MDQLPYPWAATIILYYREGKNVRDIAEILDKPENTIKTYLYRARKELYTLLQNVWEADYVRQ